MESSDTTSNDGESSGTSSIVLELGDALNAAPPQQEGLVAILDALGAKNYSQQETNQFFKSRKLVLDKAMEVFKGADADRVKTLVLNDTVLVAYSTDGPPTFADVRKFCILLRKIEVHSMAEGILFRGAASIGQFIMDEEGYSVMGPAVVDAASWYERTDWIGIIATPRTSLIIQSLLEQEGQKDLEHFVLDYDVPIKEQQKGQSTLSLKAINWPKGFHVKHLTPVEAGEKAKAKFLSLLTRRAIPLGTESKYFNSIRFFDHCIDEWLKEEAEAKRGSAHA